MSQWPVPIEIDWENRVMKAGAFTRSHYFTFPKEKQRCLQWVSSVLPTADFECRPNKSGWKDCYKWVSENLGSSFFRAWNKAAYLLWVVPVKEDADKLCRTFRGRIDPDRLVCLYSTKATIDQAKADGNHNLIPLIFKTGMTPQEMKAAVGKGIWKRLCRNTFTRNKAMAEHFRGPKDFTHPYLISTALALSSTILTHRLAFWEHPEQFKRIDQFLRRNKKLTKTNSVQIHSMLNCGRDTERMARQLNLPFNPDWSINAMMEKHDEYSSIITAKKHSKDKYLLSRKWIESLEDGDYSATLLTSAFAIAEEGRTMKHCVASYASVVQQGQCAIYSVRKGGERVSTLQLFPTEDGGVRVGQHYGPCNQVLSKRDKEATDKLIGKLMVAIKSTNESFKL